MRNQTERGKGISLKPVPRLEHCVHARRLWIHHERKVNRETVIECGREEVDGGWPTAKKLLKRLRAESPFGTEDLRLAAQGICQNIELARNELQKQMNLMLLAKPENDLSHGLERLRMGTTLLLEIR